MTLAGTRPPTLDEWNKYELHHRARLAITEKEGQNKFEIYDKLFSLNEGIDPNREEEIDIQGLINKIYEVSNLNIEKVVEKNEIQNKGIHYQHFVEFIDTVADAIGEQLIENRFIQLMSIYRSKKSKGELYKHAICKAQIIVSYVKGSTYFT